MNLARASLLKPSQAAPLMGVAHRTVLDWIDAGVIPASAVVRVGRSKLRPHYRLRVRELVAAGLIVRPEPQEVAP